MKSFGVFCGSAFGNEHIYKQETERLISYLVQNGNRIIYGGGKVGLMGHVADITIQNKGEIVGVMPKHLVDKEIAHKGLKELVVVESMHQRKFKIAEMSDVFLALPGGPGTLEEVIEQWTWGQLGVHVKPCIFYNINGYFAPLIEFFKKMVDSGFMKIDYFNMLIITDDPNIALQRALEYVPPVTKWKK